MRPLPDRLGDDPTLVTAAHPGGPVAAAPTNAATVAAADSYGLEPADAWRIIRQPETDVEWLRLELSPNGFPAGEAWHRFSDALETALSVRARRHRTSDRSSRLAVDEPQSVSQVANGLFEAARMASRCRHHEVPLHVWLGGAIRTEVPITLPISLSGTDGTSRLKALEQQCLRIRAATDSYGVRSFSLHDTATDLHLIAEAIVALRTALGPDARLTLRLARQFSVRDARILAAMIRGCDLLAFADPCDTVPSNARATDASLPALGLSAGDYDRAMLLDCLATTPPAVLFVDPIREGGLVAARRLAAVATVLHIDVAFTAAEGGPWLAGQCASLAAVLPAACQPIELPRSWVTAWLDAAEVESGAMRLDAIPRLSRLQCAPEQD